MPAATADKTIDGIILRAHPSGEADLVLKILTPTAGKIAAIAKHARKSSKRFGSALETFDCGRFELRRGRGSLPVLAGFAPISNFVRLRDNLDKIATAALLCELADHLTLEDGEGEPEQFMLLTRGLDTVQFATSRTHLMQVAFDTIAGLMSEAGFLNQELLGTGSVKRLVALLDQAERSTEKKLSTRAAFAEVMELFKKEHLAS
ncbi:MAG: DNA repair protein RecO [Proteobacteria bacterium]|nr:DNA repair protein RecO [Pseudomonadota bacterium]